MYAFYDPNYSLVPNKIMGGMQGSDPNHLPASQNGWSVIYIDETAYPDVYNNQGLYKIDPSSLLPVHLTQAEIDALNASYVPPEPTADEKIATLQKDHNLLKQSHQSTSDTLNGMMDYLSQTGVL